MTQPIRIGLLGASRIAPGAVIEPAKSNARFAVTSVAARDPERARAYAAEHGVPAVAESYAELVRREDVDLVYVALPPAGHLEWTLAALEAGKAVLCEKPFARNAQEAEQMTADAAARGLPLIEAFHYRFHRVMRDAVHAVKAGAIGRIVRGEAQFEVAIARTPGELRWSAAQGGGGLMDLGCYPLHALRSLLGEEPRVSSAKATFEDGVDSTLHAELAFPSGATGRIDCSMIPERPQAWLRLQGERGSLEIINFLAPQRGCRFTIIGADGVAKPQPTEGPSTYAAQLDQVGEVLAGTAAPLTGGVDAVANMRAIDAIYAAAGRPA